MNRKAIPQKAHICKALLAGEVLSIMDGFKRFKVTNLPREVSRQIEQKFGVVVSRDRVEFFHDCGTPGFFVRYRLNRIDANADGIALMESYVNEFFPKKEPEAKGFLQPN